MTLSRIIRVLVPLATVFAAVALVSTIFVPTAAAATNTYVLGFIPTADPDGGGAGLVEINDTTGEVCYDLRPTDIDPVTVVHIHTGGPGVNGGVHIGLDVTSGLVNCLTAPPADAAAVNANPNGFYLNIHTTVHGGGAIRAQMDQEPVCAGQIATVVVGLVGMATPGDDIVFGSGGDDLIKTLAGDDTICGNGGDDDIRGGAGIDSIFGGPGNDDIRGGGGGDFLFGESGDDKIRGQGGIDNIEGGDGADDIDGLGAADFIDGGPGDDTIAGQNGSDTMTGGGGLDDIRGNTGPDIIDGNDDDDTLSGGQGNDTLTGGPGFDRCAGNTGPADQAEAATCETTPGVEILF